MLMARDFIPLMNTPLAARLWRIAVAILAGAGGNILLIGFLSSLVGPQTLAGLLDWILGFNAALTGYMLIEKCGTGLPYRRIVCIGAGVANALITILALNYMHTNMYELALIETADAAILLTIGAILGCLGGVLAEKYLKIKQNIS